MNEQQQILFMQIRILRIAAQRFNLSLKEAAQLFKNSMFLNTSVRASEFSM
jgi:hypothetical protein